MHFTWKPWSKHSEGKQDMELLWSFLDVIYMNFNLHEANVALATIWPRLMETLQRIKMDNRAKRENTLRIINIHCIYTTTETENLADNIQTDRKAYGLFFLLPM